MPIVLEKGIPKLAIVVRHLFGYAASYRGGITQHKVRHAKVAIEIIVAELPMRRKRRLVTQCLVRLNIKTHGESVFSLSDGQGIVILLHHVVTFDGAIVRIPNIQVILGKTEVGEPFVSRRESL